MASDGDVATMSDMQPSSLSNGITAARASTRSSTRPSRQQELFVDDIEEEEEQEEEGEEEEGEKEGEKEGEEEEGEGENEREEEEEREDEREEEGTRRGTEPCNYQSGGAAVVRGARPHAHKAGSHDRRMSKPLSKDRNDRQDVGGERWRGRIPTPELRSTNTRRHHLDTTTPSEGGLLSSPPKPSSPPLHYPPTSHHPSLPPSQPHFGHRSANRDSDGFQDTHHLGPHPENAGHPPPLPVTSPPRPPHLIAANHRLPAPSSMAFSIPLSPERSEAGAARWLPFVRKQNKGLPRSGVSSQGQEYHPPGKGVPPPLTSHKSTHLKTSVGHSKPRPPQIVTANREVHSTCGDKTTGKDTHSHTRGSGSLGTCNTCGAYLFASTLGGDGGVSRDKAPPTSKHLSGSSCQLCAKGQSQPAPAPMASTDRFGTGLRQSDKPYAGVHRAEAPHHSGHPPGPMKARGDVLLQPSRTSEPARHTGRLERQSSELSLSSLSLSSCSVASDVLSRARERKDFWSSTAPPATE